MKLRRIFCLMLSMVLAMTMMGIPAFAAGNNGEGVTFQNKHYKYFYQQLGSTKNSPAASKKIYEAMEYMYSHDMMKKSENLDLIDKGYISSDLVQAYQRGNNDLIVAVENARDAFYMDYPECFYVNMEKFQIRITVDAAKKYHVWLGTGNNDSYYVEGFSKEADINSAKSALETKINSIVNAAKAKTSDKDKVESVYQQVMAATDYKLDNACKTSNRGHIRTPYGPLVQKESVCEGYAKSIKACLDQLEIPCVLVRGTFNHGGSATNTNIERHMWAEVQLDGKWYALDATFDDIDGALKNYFCVGQVKLAEGHYADGIMSAPEVEFAYPEVEYENHGTVTAYSKNGLTVNYTSSESNAVILGPLNSGAKLKEGTFYVSYNGMNVKEAAAKGYYFLVKYYLADPKTGKVETKPDKWGGTWYYLLSKDDPDAGTYRDVAGIVTTSDTTVNTTSGPRSMSSFMYQWPCVQIAVTRTPMDPRWKNTSLGLNRNKYQAYQGEDKDLVVMTGLVESPDSTMPAPNLTSSKPYIGTKLIKGQKVHMDLFYGTEELVRAEGETPRIVTATDYRLNGKYSTTNINAQTENFKYTLTSDGARIEFDFTPSEMWLDDSVQYYFYVEGLVGKYSKRKPHPAYYYCQTSLGCTASMKASGNWRAYARPTLIASSDMSTEGWTTKDGASIDSSLTDQLALVTSKTTKSDEQAMENAIRKDSPVGKMLESETYNIDLTFCSQSTKIPDGHKVTVYLGFPEGYGPNDAGVTFKAYHFKRDKNGNISTVEEIPCVVTPYGLLVTCKSFSPFAVAAMEKTALEKRDTSKTVVVSGGDNGTVQELSNGESMVTLKSGESRTLTVKANSGYAIDKIKVCGSEVEGAFGQDSYKVTLAYDKVIPEDNIVEATFVSKTVLSSEKSRGEVPVISIRPASFVNFPTEAAVQLGKDLKLDSKVISSDGTDTYQWYKDGKAIKGATSPVLTIKKAKASDRGIYQLRVSSKKSVAALGQEVSSNDQSPKCELYVQESLKSAKMTLGKSAYTYDGKIKQPSVKVKFGKKTLKKDTDYRVTYSTKTSVGKVAVKVDGIKNYSGSKTLYFKINPKGTKLASVTGGKKSLTAKWKKQTSQTGGYEVMYAASAKFARAKTATVKSAAKTSKAVVGLQSGKKYYVKVRTFKKVGSTKYYSSWSSSKSVRVK